MRCCWRGDDDGGGAYCRLNFYTASVLLPHLLAKSGRDGLVHAEGLIDSLYKDCGGRDDFDANVGPVVKTVAESMGCSGAMSSPVSLIATAFALFAGHWLN
jgi:hypothetical protein